MSAGIYFELLQRKGSVRTRQQRLRRWRLREEARAGRMLAAAETPQAIADVRLHARTLAIFFDGAIRTRKLVERKQEVGT